MTKKNKIYTKTGDDGTTGLVGGTRVYKYDLRLETYGTVDELNAALGVIRSSEIGDKHNANLIEIQNKLFNIGARLASDEKGDSFTLNLSIKEKDIRFLENSIDELEEELPELKQFILPGGDMASDYCHVARTICRRAERRIIEFSVNHPVQPEIIFYINRLSDFLFMLARKLSANGSIEDTPWKQF
jgi:cob(I)alamin adenosyltransferase